MAVTSFECADFNDTTGLTDVPVVLDTAVGRSSPNGGATIVVVGLWSESTAGNYEVTGADDDAATNAFYGTSLWSDGLNQYFLAQQFQSSSFTYFHVVIGLILHPLSAGDTITVHYSGTMNAVRTYARAYTGVYLERTWVAPDEVTVDQIIYPYLPPAPDAVNAMSLIDGDSAGFPALEDEYQFLGNKTTTLGPWVWSSPTTDVDPFTTDGGLGVYFAFNGNDFQAGPFVWDDGSINVVENFDGLSVGSDFLSMSWGEKAQSANDIIDPRGDWDTDKFSTYGWVLKAGRGPNGTSTFRPHIYRRN